MRMFPLFLLIVLAACSRAAPEDAAPSAASDAETAAQVNAADEASLLKVARDAGVSDQAALDAKAKLDKIYDDTSAKMNQAEVERNARDAAFKDDTCVADCDQH